VDRGDADAQNKLAAMYNEGLGVPRDHGAALKLLEQAAAQGYAPAMASLGRMYIEALGVDRDDVRGYALTRAALDLGVPSSVQQIATAELDAAKGRLNRGQIKRAQQMAAQLTAPPAPATTQRPESQPPQFSGGVQG
jgi:TPR repeat protein